MIRSLFYLAVVLAALLYLTGHVAQAGSAGPADLCPPPAHTSAGDACGPCDPERCSASSTIELGCIVIARVTRGDDYLETVGRLTYRQSGPGFDYAELDGRPDRAHTGRARVLTIRPPLDLEVIRCPR